MHYEVPFEILIDLEISVAALYKRFAMEYPEDRSFWLTLQNEEYEHAAILRKIQDQFNSFAIRGAVQFDLSREVVEMILANIHSLIEEMNREKLSRKEALWMALQLEQSAGEFHLKAISRQSKAPDIQAIELWKDDFDHATRIRSYLKELKK